MVRKKTLILSIIIAALLVSIIHINPDGTSHYASTALFLSSFQGLTWMNAGAFTTGILIEYTIFLFAVYLLLRGISKKFER